MGGDGTRGGVPGTGLAGEETLGDAGRRRGETARGEVEFGGGGEERPAIWDVFGSTENGKK